MKDVSHAFKTASVLPSVQLDALETTVQPTKRSRLLGEDGLPVDPGVSFRHSGWAPRRKCVTEAMAGIEDSEQRQARFDGCGSHAWILESVDDPGHYKVACNRCRDRFCLPCSRDRSRHIASVVGEFACDREVRMITLTIRQSDRDLRSDVDHLFASFTKLRRRKIWTRGQQGGIYFLEVKRRKSSAGWHTHMHVLTEGFWIDRKELSKAWLTVTGDSMIVDIRLCETTNEAARYAAKYAGKAVHGNCYHDATLLRTAMIAVKGRRYVGKFGTWKDLDLDSETDDGEWRPVDSLERLLRRIDDGDATAAAVLNALMENAPCDTERKAETAHGP